MDQLQAGAISAEKCAILAGNERPDGILILKKRCKFAAQSAPS